MNDKTTGMPEEGFRLSPAQRRLWTLASAGNAAFGIRGTFKTKKTLDAELLGKALKKVVEDYEILRTSLRPHRNFRFPLQIIANVAAFHFEEYDVERLSEAERAVFIEKLVKQAEEAEKDSPEKSAWLNVALLKTGAAEDVLLLFLSAFFCDRAGLINLTTEISRAYRSFEQHREYESDSPQFADISEWQNENLESDETRPAREFWKDAPRLLAEQTTLPFENKSASDAEDFRPALVEAVISGEIFERLKRRSESSGNLENRLLACWMALLFKYLNSAEIIVGVGFDGREFPELKKSLGNLTRYAPISTPVEAGRGFNELAGDLEKRLTDSHDWQDGFFWDLTTDEQNATGFWKYCFDLTDACEIDGENIFAAPDVYDYLEKYRLCIGCFLLPDSLKLKLRYDSAVYSQNEAERILNQFLKTVSIVAQNPSIRLGAINFITDKEKEFLIREINETFFDYAEDQPFHQLFERQAEKSPQAVAVVCGDCEITYGELNSKSNQLAHELIERGIKPDDIVGIYLFPTTDYVVAMLGAVKAGAGYLPLDPANPLPRLAYMANDAAPKVIITQKKIAGNDLKSESPRLIIDDFAFDANDLPNPGVPVDAENLAYLIYTSGSTGNPKGVAVTHRGLSNYLQWCLHNYAPEKGSGAPVHSSTGFDLSITGIMSPLIAGKKTHLLGENSSITALIELLESHNDFSFIKITPSHLEILRVLLSEKSRAAIRLLIVGGEALYGESFESWRDGFSETLIVNEYGPTETVVGCITFEKRAGEIEPGNVPIGRPIKNTEVYVLDEAMNPVAVGVAGELYLGGKGVARGYWNQAALTAASFVPHPFGQNGARLYKTGDLGRFLADGQIEYLGRADRQIKIRGYRVEPGEIEGQIKLFSGVADAAVDMKADSRGDQQLVCYFVAAARQAVDANLLRAYLKDKLPEYMIPARFMELENIPLTSNGKVDRERLPEFPPEIDESKTGLRKESGNPVREILVNIWEEILGRQVTGSNDNFFELGGHSLLATQLISRLRDAFGVELELGVIFDNPQLDALAEKIATRMAKGGDEVLPPIKAVAKDQPLPLSFAQQRMWFLNQFEGASGNYNVSFPLLAKGKINIQVLEKSIDFIKTRHDVLRTSFGVDEQGNLFQKINPETPPTKIEFVDLSGLEDERARADAGQIVNEQSRFKFDLSGNEPFQVILIKLSDAESVLSVTMHHIISDGWSTAVFVRELAAAYRAFLDHALPDLPPLPFQYADYAVWQRSSQAARRFDSQLQFWKEQLGTPSAPLALPTDFPRPAVRTFGGAKQFSALAGDLVRRLKQLSRAENATLFMTLLAAFQLWLSRVCRQTEINVGTPTANRQLRELEDLIGFFVNTLVIRGRLNPGDSFLEHLKRVRAATLAAYAHQEIPFEKLVEELRPERELSRTPLFDVMFVMQNAPTEKLELEGLELSGFGMRQETAKFDLTLTVDEAEEEQLVIGIEYNTDLFQAESIKRYLQSFEELLTNIVAEPEREIRHLNILPAPERERLITGLNQTQKTLSAATIIELIAKQADAAPERVAISFAGRTFTYSEFNSAAEAAARRLSRRGIKRGAVVGISSERSADLPVALLAVLKAGASYLPVDPDFPASRIGYMLADSNARFVLGDEARRDDFAGFGIDFIAFKTLFDKTSEESDVVLPSISGDDAAYIIYTSGSTGQPKGVVATHHAVVRLVEADYLMPGADDVFLQYAPVSFDASTLEIWTCFAHGAKLVIAPPEKLSTILLGKLIADEKITIIWLTAGMFHLIIDEQPESLGNLRYLIAGGAVLQPEKVRQAAQNLPGVRLINGYGPTETTTFACCYAVESDGWEGSSVPIGEPISNTQVYVLDEWMRLVPQGVVGELFIGGDGLARGYLNRNALTAEKFIPDPFSGKTGARLYRTGDLGRWNQSGKLEFMGRADRQLKVRGYRIEPGEIETALGQSEQIKRAAVVAEGEGLTAYLVRVPGIEKIDIESLREELNAKLPAFLRLQKYFEVEEIPLTRNGKIDEEKLKNSSAKQLRLTEAAEREQPVGEIEKQIAVVWSELLEIDEIDRRENFFDLGGHSLLAIQAITRFKKLFKVEVSIRSLFEHPTLAGFAALVESSRKNVAEAEDSITSQENVEFYPLSFAQKRVWFIQQFDPQSSTYNVSVTLKLEGELRPEIVNQAFSIIARRHAVLRTRFITIDGMPYQQIPPPENVEVEVSELSGAEEVRKRISEFSGAPFELSEGKLFRAALFKLGERENILHLTIHHIASDGLSLNILVREFSAIYAALVAGKTPELPALAIKYADFAFRQDKDFREGKFAEKIRYWKKTLGGAPTVLNLPTDKPRPRILSGAGEKYRFVLPESLRTKVADFSKNNDVTMFMSFLAAFFAWLSKYAAQDEILVGTPVANRDRLELENLVGFFANTVVIKGDLTGEPTFAQLVKRIKEVALSAFTNQDVPFEMLVEELKPERSISRNPLFQAMFAYQHKTSAKMNLPKLKITPVEAETKNSMFDLTFTVFEADTETGVEIEYSSDLFLPASIARMGEGFQILLERILESPDEKLNRVSMLAAAEREEYRKRRAPSLAEKENLLFHRMFEEQARKTSDAVAVIQDDEQLTYAELNARANRLAAFLQAKGVGAEKIVAVYQNRSIQMVVSILAVLKAGGAYIPLEPDSPASRVNTILSEIPSAFVISETPRLDELQIAPEHKINPVAEAETIAAQPAENLAPDIDSHNAAYLIYTSGSTGRPKGIVISHHALCNHLLWMLDFQSYKPAQRFIMSSSLSFDASIWELHKPLVSGASTVVVNTKQQLDLDYLFEQIRRYRVTSVQSTPTFLSYLLKHPEAGRCASLEEVFVGGETLTPDVAEKFNQTLGCPLYNAYGPTETTVDATITIVGQNWQNEKISIGQAIANKYVYILDKNLNLLPDGVPGEICIGGAGLARGYFKRPRETAASFVPDLFATVPGGRIYRTGDFGRYLPDGGIEFLGRKDRQVKVNGQRLELAEIEAVCLQIPQIGEAVVELRDHGERRKIVAFLVSQNGEKPSGAEIRAFLRRLLPEYMIPESFQWLDAMPVLPSGKTDRKSLRADFSDADQSLTDYITPETDAQRKIAHIWQEVLERENVGLRDNFFDLGGHSLLLIQIHDRLAAAFEKNVSILDLFTHPTVESLADFLTSETAEDTLAEVKQRAAQRQKRAAKNRDLRQKRSAGREMPEN